MEQAVILAVVLGACGLAFLGLFWPGARQGRRLLARWGIAAPEEQEVGHAVTYLRSQRVWYPWLFAAFGLLFTLWPGPSAPGAGGVAVAAVLCGALIAEIFAQRPTRGPRRVAVLAPRGVRSLVPAWALVLLGAAALALAVVGAGSLAGTGWAQTLLPRASAPTALAAGGVTVVLVAGVLVLAARRPPVAEPRLDEVLRIRSARVATGLGIAVLAVLTSSPTVWSLPAFLVTVAGLVAWRAVAAGPDSPTPRPVST
ncbi:MAG: hypothetical protein ACRDQA_27315 [Nocardioidaceae bacterium]